MKKMISRVTFWIYSLTYGPSPATPPFTLKHINGSGLGGTYYDSLMTSWQTSRTKLTQLASTHWKTLQQWSSTWAARISTLFRPYPAKHRDGLGSRQTYAGQTVLRAQREAAWHDWQAFLDMRVPETVGVATLSPPIGSRAYRKLAPSILNKETRELIRAYAPKDWLDD